MCSRTLFQELKQLISDALYWYVVTHEILCENQSGFFPGDLTVKHLLSTTNEIFKPLDCNFPLDVCSVNIGTSKALDRV